MKNKKVFGTKEWAKYSANSTIGCSNDCKYCYARASYIKKGNDSETWTDENRINFEWNKKDGVIMFPTNHDITTTNYDDALKVLNKLLSTGNDVLIVSKPKFEVIERLLKDLKDYKDKILFRFTIGSSDNKVLKFWEPNASLFEERLDCLKLAFNEGFATSVSMEPYLDLNTSDVVKTANKFLSYSTNSVWIGKMNGIDTRIADIDENIINDYNEAMKDENIWKIYNSLKSEPKIRWKESIKKVIGLELATETGLDI